MSDPIQNAELGDVLACLGRQLRETHCLGRHLEEAIGDLIRNSSREGRVPTGSFQKLDVLVQSLENLACFIDTLAKAVPEGTMVDAREAHARVKLRALSKALMQQPDEEDTAQEDLHLF